MNASAPTIDGRRGSLSVAAPILLVEAGPGPEDRKRWAAEKAQAIADEIARSGFALGESRAALLVEPIQYQGPGYGRALLKAFPSLFAAQRWDALYCINVDDCPGGFLPGLYSSAEGRRYDRSIHRIWPNTSSLRHLQHRLASIADASEPDLLFCFRGNPRSNPIRQRLLQLYGDSPHAEWSVSRHDGWYNHSAADTESYLLEMMRSRFALCPAGYAAYTNRILEAVALGSVPAVVADAWRPWDLPPPLAELPWFVRIPEAQIHRVPEILRAIPEETRLAMASHCRRIYRECFSRDREIPAMLERIAALHRELGPGASRGKPANLPKRWRSLAFRLANGWTLPQRCARAAARRFRSAAARAA